MLMSFWGPILYEKADRLGTYAAALAFYFVLSLVPFLMVTATAAALVSPISLASKYEEILAAVLPMESANDRQMIIHAVSTTSSRGLATLGFILAVYTSFNFMQQIVRTLLFIFDHPKALKVSFFREMAKSFVLLLLWMAFLTVICLSFVIMPLMRSMLASIPLIQSMRHLPVPDGMMRITTEGFFSLTSELVVSVTLFAAFYLTFALVSSQQYRPRTVFFAACLSTIGWIGCSILYVFILQRIWSANAVYGALGLVIAILLWGQSCAWAVIAGACFIVRFSPLPKRRRTAKQT